MIAGMVQLTAKSAQTNTMHPLYDHQKRILAENRHWSGLWLGTGSAKSRTSLHLAEGRTLIIVPKQQRGDKHWEKETAKWEINLDTTVISKEEFRRDWESLELFDTVIVDEAHYFFSGVHPETRTRKGKSVPKMSQMYEALYEYLKKCRPKRLYLLTATPASKPMHVLAACWLIGGIHGAINFFDFRSQYYFEKKMGFRSIWLPRNTEKHKEELAALLKEIGYTGQLSDYFDVPEQTEKTIYVELTKEQKNALQEIENTEADPMSARAKARTIENGILYEVFADSYNGKEVTLKKRTRTYENNKTEYIIDLVGEFRKVLVFATYLGQISSIAEQIQAMGTHKVYTLTGSTPGRSEIISQAEKDENCVVIAQSGISSGYELKSFNCVVFASLSRLVRDEIQGRGRVLRADALKHNLYVYLVTKGGCDEECYDTIKSGLDFQEKVME